MKILHLISSLYRGGRERQLASIVANTNSQLYPSKIVYFNKIPHSYVDEYHLEDLAIQLQTHGKMSRMKELNQILTREKPDIVYTWGYEESISILLLRPFHKFRFINGSIRHGIRSRRFSHYLRTLILHMSPYIVANSKAGLHANHLHRGEVLYNGIDGRFLCPMTDRAARRLALTGISPDIPLLISVANLVPYKDYFSVLKALKKLKDTGISFFYLIIGHGPMYNNIIRTISEYGLDSSVRIVEHVSNVDMYLKVSDIFVHSSKGEGCSNAILEAMAAGLPIVASNTGGTDEVVDTANGLLFKYQNDVQLADYLAWLIHNPINRKKMGKCSHEKVQEGFTMEKMMNRYYDVLNQVYNHSNERKNL